MLFHCLAVDTNVQQFTQYVSELVVWKLNSTHQLKENIILSHLQVRSLMKQSNRFLRVRQDVELAFNYD